MKRIQIQDVKFEDGFFLRIYLSDGCELILDMNYKLLTARFKEISTWEKFCKGKIIDGRIIQWTVNVELTLEEIEMLSACKKENS